MNLATSAANLHSWRDFCCRASRSRIDTYWLGVAAAMGPLRSGGNMLDSEGSGAAVLAVACPGGMARQFRVQTRDERTPGLWRLVGSFRRADAAQAAVQRLAKDGTAARIVECRTLPTAA